MSIYAAVLYIVVPILAAVVVVLLKAFITESRKLKKEPLQEQLGDQGTAIHTYLMELSKAEATISTLTRERDEAIAALGEMSKTCFPHNHAANLPQGKL
jgi:CBS domain containing-hemolysin-like protein